MLMAAELRHMLPAAIRAYAADYYAYLELAVDAFTPCRARCWILCRALLMLRDIHYLRRRHALELLYAGERKSAMLLYATLRAAVFAMFKRLCRL